jgi:Ca2+/H+ antiporter
MAGTPIDRIPLHTMVLPMLGMGAWLLAGKVGLGPLALLLAVVLLGNVIAAVHHAEVVALRAGEPFGTLVLALAVTVIEVGLIISMMVRDQGSALWASYVPLSVTGASVGAPSGGAAAIAPYSPWSPSISAYRCPAPLRNR